MWRWPSAASMLNDFAYSQDSGHCAGETSVPAAKSFNVAAKRLYLALAEAGRPPGPPRRPEGPALAYRRGASLLARAGDHISRFPLIPVSPTRG